MIFTLILTLSYPHPYPNPYPNPNPDPNYVRLVKLFFEFRVENGKIELMLKEPSDNREVPDVSNTLKINRY